MPMKPEPKTHLRRQDLMSLEEYAEKRVAFREQVMRHKKNRQVAVGPNARLYFEDRVTMQYQLQEILRIEKTFEPAAIEEELAVYNPLIPDGSNWKATFMLEFAAVEARRQALAKLLGVERGVWVRVGDESPVSAIANEDLVRATADKTSAVHFLRFELSPAMVAAAQSGAPLHVGVEHAHYQHQTRLPAPIAQSLVTDLRV